MWQLGLVGLGAQIPSQIEPQQGKCWFECQYTTGPEGGDPDCTEPHKGKLEISAVPRTGENAETRRSGPGQTDEAPHSSDLHLECEVGQGHLAEVALEITWHVCWYWAPCLLAAPAICPDLPTPAHIQHVVLQGHHAIATTARVAVFSCCVVGWCSSHGKIRCSLMRNTCQHTCALTSNSQQTGNACRAANRNTEERTKRGLEAIFFSVAAAGVLAAVICARTISHRAFFFSPWHAAN